MLRIVAIAKYKILLTSQIRVGFTGAVTPAFTPPTCDCPCDITDGPTGIAVHQLSTPFTHAYENRLMVSIN